MLLKNIKLKQLSKILSMTILKLKFFIFRRDHEEFMAEIEDLRGQVNLYKGTKIFHNFSQFFTTKIFFHILQFLKKNS